MNKIVAVKYDDGTERAVNDIDLKRYLETREYEEICAAIFPVWKPWQLKEMVDALARVRREELSETNSKNAGNSRNEFAKRADAKQALITFKDQYERVEGKTHGWRAKAYEAFLIDPATLKRILSRK